ncbi:GNAT family N-acetyltransferase [Sphingomonas abietis]|uniref:GNAT family N-acetyltransferase n=1 Tax=Sphingomonas abietis TaxID=3012344 RepID=A0ABY7NK35_9SPHN|nr:GNAT family N-acetyltransferase [Sphingomonas abietis]WBO20962.1 GNAT family N-acetyltransferase [Sphingomonas abietis]
MLETERLTIRRIGLDDAGFMLASVNDPGFISNIGDRGVRTIEDAETYIRERVLASYAANGFGMFRVALKDGDEGVGTIGFVRRDGLDKPDLGFAFLEAHVGKGYAYEAATALMAWGRATLGIGPLLAITAPANAASAGLLVKLGFRETGRIMLPTHGGESRLFAEG